MPLVGCLIGTQCLNFTVVAISTNSPVNTLKLARSLFIIIMSLDLQKGVLYANYKYLEIPI